MEKGEEDIKKWAVLPYDIFSRRHAIFIVNMESVMSANVQDLMYEGKGTNAVQKFAKMLQFVQFFVGQQTST